jgi:hypothetical protein
MSQAEKCVIRHCQSENNKLFIAPANPRELYKWKQLVGTTRNNFFICELHFEENATDYEKVLRDSALPSLLLNEHEMIQESSCECCLKSIYRNDRKYCINNLHRDVFKIVFAETEVPN